MNTPATLWRAPDGPRVLFLTGREDGPLLWRVGFPCAALMRRGYIVDKWPIWEADDVLPRIAAGLYDAVILTRISWKLDETLVAKRWLASLRRAGCTIIYEVDDDIFTPQIAARQQQTIEAERSLEELEQDRRNRITALRMCDGVTVSNDTLAAVVRQYTELPVHVVPNAIDTGWFRGALRDVKRTVPPLTIGWAGGARYSEDLEPVAAAWSAIAARYPDVTFVVQGHIADVLVDAVPPDRVRRLGWLPLSEYACALLNIDIGCASVADKHFNRCKTPIKLWEYTVAGAAVVASPTLYGEVATDGQDVLIAESAAEWETALSRLIEDRRFRRRLRQRQYRRLEREHSIESHAQRWLDAWASIVDVDRSSRIRRELLAV